MNEQNNKKKNIHWSKIQIGQTKTIFRKNRKEIYIKDLFPIFFLLQFPDNCFYFIYTYLFHFFGGLDNPFDFY